MNIRNKLSVCVITALVLIAGLSCSTKLNKLKSRYRIGVNQIDYAELDDSIVTMHDGRYGYYIPEKMIYAIADLIPGKVNQLVIMYDNQFIMIAYDPDETLSIKDMIESVKNQMVYWYETKYRKIIMEGLNDTNHVRETEMIRIGKYNIAFINIIPHILPFLKRIINDTFRDYSRDRYSNTFYIDPSRECKKGFMGDKTQTDTLK